ncbi:hypothetical protein EI94DRAFT_1815328 [Lactarius quietus]|nr:hypothetical protein EI94DRAFT_1815328 [Lactarius quietus]
MARLQAIDSTCGDIDNHPFSNSFSCIIATADQILINLTADENESGLVSWLTQTETQVRFRAERLAAAEVEEALLAWKKDQIECHSSTVEADIQRALRERNTELLHQTTKTLGVDNPAPSKRRKCTHEHWKNCQDYPEAHTWVLGQPEYDEEEEQVHTLVWAQADDYPEAEEDYEVEEDEALCIGQKDEGHMMDHVKVPDHASYLV